MAAVWPASAALLMAPVPSLAQDAAKALEACARIAQAQDRLVCYDKAAGRAPPVQLPPSVSRLEPKAPEAAEVPLPGELPGRMTKFWELDAENKRGVFNFTGYRANYVLPLHVTTRINRAPASPTQATVAQPSYRHVESKFQLSLRTKAVQGLVFPNADLWFGFTQQVLWQVWNSADSKPFRNSDYEPEVIYVVPTAPGWRSLPFGWQWRYSQLGLAHQSNGQPDPLSRSWNRVYLGGGLDNGPWSLTGRVVHRLKEDENTDNNPDLVDYRGRAEVTLSWAAGVRTASLLYRIAPGHAGRGALQFDGTTPVVDSQPNGLRWYVQVFSGYAETLTDYNFRQTSVGVGVSFLQF